MKVKYRVLHVGPDRLLQPVQPYVQTVWLERTLIQPVQLHHQVVNLV
jgi:hypothetical protein